jgi:hypothetical protein
MSVGVREIMRGFLFGGHPDRLAWWQHASCWAAAVIAVSIPAVWVPVIQQHRSAVPVQVCPRVDAPMALATPPPEGYTIPSGCCGATALDDPDPAREVGSARELIRSGTFEVTSCDWFRAWGKKPW